MRTAFVALLALTLGFAAGRLLPRANNTPASPPPPPQAAVKPPPASDRLAPPPDPAQSPVSVGTTTSAVNSANRLEMLRWMKQMGRPVTTGGFQFGKIDPLVAAVLELRADETQLVNQAAVQATAEMTQARDALAQARTSEDGETLFVDIPGLDPQTSAAIYDRFMERLGTTLGPERLAIFKELTGERLDTSFERFGLNGVSYEVKLKTVPSSQGNLPLISFTQRHRDVGDRGVSTATSTLTFSELQKRAPAIVRHLPPHLRSTP